MQAFSVLIGMACGSAIGLILFSTLVPHGPQAISMFRKYASHSDKIERRNREAFNQLPAVHAMNMEGMNHVGIVAGTSSNLYIMGTVVSEHDFLVQMKLHHEAALVMAKQVLALPNIHDNVKTLANGILSTQTKEIAEMTGWLNAGK